MAAFIPAAIQAAATIGSGLLASKGQGSSETKMQRTQRKLVDSLLASLNGTGPYSDLFATDENAFNRSIVEPAQARFRNQIAPQIQQQYIASGQQRGTGLDDQLLRAGVDLDSMINEQYLTYQNQGKDRMQNMLNNILGQGAGAPNTPSTGQSLASAGAGYLSSDSFSKMLPDLSKSVQGYFAGGGNTTAPSQFPNSIPARKGFELPEFQYTR
jgi:hypothetical protein